MKSSTILRLCLVIEWVFVIIAITASFILESSLPEPLAAWLRSENDRDMTVGEVTLLAFAILILLSNIVATVGLLRLRRWAAWLYLITCILILFCSFFMGPTVGHALAETFGEIATAMSGMVIALAFFTDSLKISLAEPCAAGDSSTRAERGSRTT